MVCLLSCSRLSFGICFLLASSYLGFGHCFRADAGYGVFASSAAGSLLGLSFDSSLLTSSYLGAYFFLLGFWRMLSC
jgi:hypothetical protein